MIFSEIVGPASKWNSFHWRYVSPEQITDPAAAAYDSMTVTILGIRNNGKMDTLIKSISKNSFDIFGLMQPFALILFLICNCWGMQKTGLRKLRLS